MYADRVTGSMQRALDETNRRRAKQQAHNKKHGITPASVATAMSNGIERLEPVEKKPKIDLKTIPKDEYSHLIAD